MFYFVQWLYTGLKSCPTRVTNYNCFSITDTEESITPEFDCPVCLQNASFPVELPCHHIFCFLCVKGVANRSKRCALCRQDIPADFFRDPKLLCKDEIKEKSLCIYDEGYQWFYEGRNGWWQYDERTSSELEKKYKKGDKTFELLIAGFLYVIDLENMRQFRRNDQTRRRRVRRDLRDIPGVKGIAGLKYQENQALRPSGDGGEASHSSIGGQNSMVNGDSGSNHQSIILPSQGNDGTTPSDDSYLTPPAPNNTPQTPMTPADSQPSSLSGSQEDLSYHLHHLHIDSISSSRGSPSNDGLDSLMSQHMSSVSEYVDSGIEPSYNSIQQQVSRDNYDVEDIDEEDEGLPDHGDVVVDDCPSGEDEGDDGCNYGTRV